MKKKTIGVVYEISKNPFFDSSEKHFDDRISEFVKPVEIDILCKTLKLLGFDLLLIDGPQGLLNRIKEVKSKCCLIFNKSIGFKGLERKILVPAICQMHNLPLIGTSAYAMTLARHKYHTNKLLKGMGYPVPDSFYFDESSNFLIPDIVPFPVIVKPNHESDSLGISKNSIIEDYVSLNEKIRSVATTFEQGVIVERYIPGEEWKVAVIGSGRNARVAGNCGVMRNGQKIINSLQTREDIIFNKLDYYPVIDNPKAKEASSIALSVHRAFGLLDYSRIDFRLDHNNQLFCMEVSTHPQISGSSSFVYACMANFDSYTSIIDSIIRSALVRYPNQSLQN